MKKRMTCMVLVLCLCLSMIAPIWAEEATDLTADEQTQLQRLILNVMGNYPNFNHIAPMEPLDTASAAMMLYYLVMNPALFEEDIQAVASTSPYKAKVAAGIGLSQDECDHILDSAIGHTAAFYHPDSSIYNQDELGNYIFPIADSCTGCEIKITDIQRVEKDYFIYFDSYLCPTCHDDADQNTAVASGMAIAYRNPDSLFDFTLKQCTADSVHAVASAYDDVKVYLDGKKLIFDQLPIIENGRTMVPLRKIFESLGLKVYWDDEIKAATAVKDGVEINVTIHGDFINWNGAMLDLDVPAMLVNSRTLIPARAVSEALGCLVTWDDSNRTVNITSIESMGLTWSVKTETTDEAFDANGECIYYATHSYPEAINGGTLVTQAAIDAIYQASAKDSWKKHSFREQAIEHAATGDTKALPYGLRRADDIRICPEKNTISLVRFISTHDIRGNVYCETYTFDMTTGKQLTASEVLGLSEQETLAQCQELMLQHGKASVGEDAEALDTIEKKIDLLTYESIQNGEVGYFLSQDRFYFVPDVHQIYMGGNWFPIMLNMPVV